MFIQIRNPNAQSGIASHARDESRDGVLTGVAAFAAILGITHAIAQRRSGQAKFGRAVPGGTAGPARRADSCLFAAVDRPRSTLRWRKPPVPFHSQGCPKKMARRPPGRAPTDRPGKPRRACGASSLAWPGRLTAGLGSGGSGPAAAKAAGSAQPESNRKMAALLEKITREADPLKNPFRNKEQAAILSALKERTSDPRQLFQLRIKLAWQFLDAGDTNGALKEYDAIQQYMEDNGVPQEERKEVEWLTFKAVCYLRMGENENCLANTNADSCLFPVRGKGVHTVQRGSRGAVAVLTELLDKYPGCLRARWLLNIAYITLGEYPDKVPSKWVLDPKLFESDYDIKRFPDIAPAVGLDVHGLSGGVVLEDFDNDGFLDVMVSAWGLNDQLRLFHNNGDGTFTERTEEAGLLGLTGGLNMVHCDYNNDGFMDVMVLRGAWMSTEGHYPFSLLRNNGDFTFPDVTEEAGLLRLRPTHSAAWFDYNGDGWLDVFVISETKNGDRVSCELYRNNGDGTFTECAAENGLDYVGFFKAAATADYNNDGRPDLFLSRLDGPRILLRNDGPACPDRAPGSFPLAPRRPQAPPAQRRPGRPRPVARRPVAVHGRNRRGGHHRAAGVLHLLVLGLQQ